MSINKMNVLHLQYSSSSSGNYTITLHNLMTANGIDSSVLSLFCNFQPEDRKIHWLGKISRLKAQVDTKIQDYLNRNNNQEYGSFSFPVVGTDVSSHFLVQEADVIYVHWVLNGFLNIKGLGSIAKLGKPVIFVLHDMWTFTGGCHHSFSCEKFMVACENCQVLPKSRFFDRANFLFNKKKRFFKKFKNLFFIAPSHWMEMQAKNSSLLRGKTIYTIYNSVSKTFRKLDNLSLRKTLQISNDTKIIGFGANYVSSPYKGFNYLSKALKLLGDLDFAINIEILVFGGNVASELLEEVPFKIHYTGFLDSESKICEAYNAMDVFVVSSIADNLPTTVLESLKCGTAVVGFNTGGIPEMISHKENGYLAEARDVNDLLKGIRFCIENNLSGYLKDEFDHEEIMSKHFQLFDAILDCRGEV